MLAQTVAYDHETLKASPEALAYLKASGVDDPEAIERSRLAKLGHFRESGQEHLTGSLVIPVMDEEGRIQEVYGRKVLDYLRKRTLYRLYLPGPHQGVWNVAVLNVSKEIILCEALTDALAFWCAGFWNVTSAYGVEGFTPDHLEAFKRHGTKAGDRAAEKLAGKLLDKGIACCRVPFPKGMDGNAYA